MKPGADKCEVEQGIPSSFTQAQAALESAWGTSALSRIAFNLFGVKADKGWKGTTIGMPTREFIGGKWTFVTAQWRVYKDWDECVLDHAAFFKQNPRYNLALKCTDGVSFAHAVAAAGYATDPKYADKLVSIIHKYELKDVK